MEGVTGAHSGPGANLNDLTFIELICFSVIFLTIFCTFASSNSRAVAWGGTKSNETHGLFLPTGIFNPCLGFQRSWGERVSPQRNRMWRFNALPVHTVYTERWLSLCFWFGIEAGKVFPRRQKPGLQQTKSEKSTETAWKKWVSVHVDDTNTSCIYCMNAKLNKSKLSLVQRRSQWLFKVFWHLDQDQSRSRRNIPTHLLHSLTFILEFGC